ncbi:MAG: glycosyltransferase family 2 protein [Bryobacteraceae bacterium]|nr:glycosyltransferase family 2 protein [Bryobacteraceae bacterium]
MAAIVFWSSLAVVLYVYLAYPALLRILAVFFRRPVAKAPILPSVSLVIPAYNEQRVIEAKLRNVLSVDYPAEKLEIVVVSDGSTDATNAIVEKYASAGRVRLFAFAQNRGKIAALNDAFPHLRGEIAALSDASSMLAPDALRVLVSSFADPSVGAVSGLYRVRRQREAELGEQEGFYWSYESWLKTLEAELDSILGAHGSLYAIRTKLYPFPEPGAINDDYIIPVRIIQKGYRAVYDTRALAYEEALEMTGFKRRIRIMTGNFEQLSELRPLIWHPRWLPLFFFLSHKAGRLAVPLAMLALFASNIFLLAQPFYLAAWIAQLLFYGVVVVGALWPVNSRLLRLPYYFCMINAAAFFGLYYALIARRKMAWK